MRERLTLNVYTVAAAIILAALMAGCQQAPPTLTPDAQAAFQSTRVIKVLDVVRDAAISANGLAPATFSTADTRNVVTWHQTAVKAIEAVPSGWQSAVKQSLYALTCNVAARVIPDTTPCVSPLSATALVKINPYVSLALTAIAEVQ